jgi:hypothetical protein
MVLRTRSDITKEIEILILRHQLAVLQRRNPRPRISWPDRALIAALTPAAPYPPPTRVTRHPATILRWHQRLITRHWTTQPARSGRPSIPAGLRALAVRLATETPPGDTDASTASSPALATRSARPPSGPSCTAPASTPHPAEPDPPGPSSYEPKRAGSWPATCFISTPSPCSGCTRFLPSSTPLLPLHRPETASAAQPHDRSIVSCAAGVPVQTHGSGVVCELAITITDHGSGEVADELRW